jgi:methylglutaconyl-CoA hydratase
MQFSTLTVSCEAQVARVTLSRPDVRNAFNETVIAELATAFNLLSNSDEARVVVLGATGPAFCAGADLNWMKKMASFTRDENVADAKVLAKMLYAIWSCPKPVIAQVQGDTYAGGVGLVAACDVAIAADHANFCLSEARIGLIPATISPYVIRALGEQASRRYFVTAERFSAQRAQQLGLVHEQATFPTRSQRSRRPSRLTAPQQCVRASDWCRKSQAKLSTLR